MKVGQLDMCCNYVDWYQDLCTNIKTHFAKLVSVTKH